MHSRKLWSLKSPKSPYNDSVLGGILYMFSSWRALFLLRKVLNSWEQSRYSLKNNASANPYPTSIVAVFLWCVSWGVFAYTCQTCMRYKADNMQLPTSCGGAVSCIAASPNSLVAERVTKIDIPLGSRNVSVGTDSGARSAAPRIQLAHCVDLSVNLENPISKDLPSSDVVGVAWRAPLAGPPRGYSKVGAMFIGYLRLYVWMRFSVPAPWSHPHGTKDQGSIPSSLNADVQKFNNGLIPALSETRRSTM